MMIAIIIIFNLIFVLNAVPVDNVVNELNQLLKPRQEKNSNDNQSAFSIVLEDSDLVSNWPSSRLLDYLGEVSGLAFCPKGYLYIFHRADSKMDEESFNDKNIYMGIENGPIKENTIIKLNNLIDDSKVVAEFGKNLFYLPHGIFANKDYMLTTDVARHQILRIPHNSNKPDLIIGELFVPGDDENHFCKPTHAVIASDGSIFVADGYCNSRIVKFDKSGKYLMEFPDKNDKSRLFIPHHLVLIESKDLLCVADRENMRVQCYCAGLKDPKQSGKLIKSITDERFGSVYAVGFNNLNDMLYVVSRTMNGNERSRVFIYDWKLNMVTGALDYSGLNGFGKVHSIDVCPKGHCVAIGGLTKECSVDPLTCLEKGNTNEEYQFRNIWLYRLFDEKLDVQ